MFGRNVNIKESSKNKYPWNQEEWLEILEMDDDYDVQVKVEIDEEVLKLLKNLPSPESQNISLDDYFQDNVESLTFDDSEFMTPNNTKGLFHLNSETDPNLIDKIPVIDTSESDTENDVFLQSVLHCSSPIQWSPQRINCNENQNLETAYSLKVDFCINTSHSAYVATEKKLYGAKIDGLLPPNFL